MSDGEHLAAGKGGKRLVLRVVDGEKLGTQVRAVELHQPGEAQPQILALESGGESAIGILIGGGRAPNLETREAPEPVRWGGGWRQKPTAAPGRADTSRRRTPSPPTAL